MRGKMHMRNSLSSSKRNQMSKYEEQKEAAPQSLLAEYAQEKMPGLCKNFQSGILQHNSSKQSHSSSTLRKFGFNRSVKQLIDARNSMQMDVINGIRGNADDVQILRDQNQGNPDSIVNQSNQKLIGYKHSNINR